MNSKEVRNLHTLLVFLISSITITGIFFIDSAFWDIVFYVVGEIAYIIVSLLIMLGVLPTKQLRSDAYIFISILLILGGYAVYKALVRFKKWVLAWPVYVKILVPAAIVLLIGGIIALIILYKKGIIFKDDE